MCAPADYQHWTALKKGEDKRHIWAIRRLETSRRLEILGWRSSRTQTHPPDSGGSAPQMVDEGGVLADIHPYDVYLMGRQQTQGDWLTPDFFFRCFISACKQLGQDTTAYEQPGKMYEWFDCRANVDWRQQTDTIKHTRGGLPYTEPNGFYGFAVNVLGKYDNGDNRWMKADGSPGEWAIAYHGTKVSGFPQILQKGFIAGGGQAYAGSQCVKTGKTVGVGVYCTPGLYTASRYGGSGHTFEGHQIVFVMQCRVRPSAIKHVSDCATDPEAFWVVNDPKDIRPYRVLITKMNC